MEPKNSRGFNRNSNFMEAGVGYAAGHHAENPAVFSRQFGGLVAFSTQRYQLLSKRNILSHKCFCSAGLAEFEEG